MKTTVIQFVTTGMGDGGAETLIKDYVLLLDKEKFNVLIVCLDKLNTASANYKRLANEGITIVSLSENEPKFKLAIIQKLWNRLFHKKYIAHQLLKLVDQYHVNTIHAHLEVLACLSEARKKLANLGVNLLFTCHNEPTIIFKKTKWDSEENAANKLIKEAGLKLIALHDRMRMELNDRFHVSDTIVIHNGVDYKKFSECPVTRNEKRASLCIPDTAFVMGLVGRFVEAKNHGFLIDIFKCVHDMNQDSYLLLIGIGPNYDSVVEKIDRLGLKSNVLILSSRTDIPELLKAMDVFVMPSIYEGLPVSMVEAQAAGLRCVASDNITPECFFSSNAIPLSLKQSAEEWAKVIIDTNYKSSCNNDLTMFDMTKEIKRLESLYIGKNI